MYNLEVLHLYWLGRHLVNNPWCGTDSYNMDRSAQRVDNLFKGGNELKALRDLDLSGFYQTVVSVSVQMACEAHLSSSSQTR